MKSQFAKSWVSSTQPRKQRKYRYNAPLNIRQKFMGAHLSADLRKKYGLRNIAVRTGDSVKIARGQYKGKIGKVERVDLKKSKLYVTGVDIMLKKGTKSMVPIEPSNVVIQDMDLTDRKRKERVEMNKGKKEK